MPSHTDQSASFGMGASRPSGLRSMFASKFHKRAQSTGQELGNHNSVNRRPVMANGILPPDHPHSRGKGPLSERGVNPGSSSAQRSSRESPDDGVGHGLHKKTKSNVSLKSLLGDKDKKSSPSKRSSPDGSTRQKKPKKTKSSTSLSSLFKRSKRGRKDSLSDKEPDKENTAPGEATEDPASPVWPQFDSQSRRGSASTHVSRSNRTLGEEMSLYTPKGYNPSRQRNFHDYQPSLTKRSNPKARPKSDLVSSNPFLVRDRLGSGHQRPLKDQNESKPESNSRRTSMSECNPGQKGRRDSGVKPGGKVLAALSGFNSKEKRAEETKALDPQKIDAAFEELLDARNIPHNMRDKMRSLDVSIKADFIAKNRGESVSSNSSGSGSGQKHKRNQSSRGQNQNIRDIFTPNQDTTDEAKPRPRSGHFGLPKVASPRKESRPDSLYSHGRQRSGDITRPSSKGSTKPDEMTDPSDFVHYLKEVQKPAIVEVGKLHKLRILLRNETVNWVETFMSLGGMDELVDLVYRIIKVEWREEHEDNLLHEVLLCLKGLCTTSPALRRLSEIEDTLFPALLGMLFNEEKKGPSEFTTRGIIISLLFNHLSAAGPAEQASRARTILSYLRDPSQPQESQPLAFIANIYQARPYRVWCTETSNVTKEVFWIFLHHLNVVPRCKSEDFSAEASIPFVKKYYPPPHPPVPAAPYIGGVEWDATNYLANHMDLMNGLIASLPTVEERNTLRTDLRASGFEKVMGRSLRTCKEKLYPAIHEGLKIWVAAATEDNWDYQAVREGPPRDAPCSTPSSPVKGGGAPGSPKKKQGIVSEAPPKLDFEVGASAQRSPEIADGWI